MVEIINKLSIGGLIRPLMLIIIGWFSLPLPLIAVELTWGGEIRASHGGLPLPVSEQGMTPLSEVESATFTTTFVRRHSLSSSTFNNFKVVCVENIKNYLSENTSTPNPAITDIRLYNERGEIVSLVTQSASNVVWYPENGAAVGSIVTETVHHTMNLRINAIYRPFEVILDEVYECAAFPAIGDVADIHAMTYHTLRITDLFSVAVPSINAPSSLHLGSCMTPEVLSKDLVVQLSHEGRHYGLTGRLSATVVGDTNTLTIKAGNHDLAVSSIEIPSTQNGDYPLKVSTPCPTALGDYRWTAMLTYTIE